MDIFFIALFAGLLVYYIFRGLGFVFFPKEKTIDILPKDYGNPFMDKHNELLIKRMEYHEYLEWCKETNQPYVLDFDNFTIIKST